MSSNRFALALPTLLALIQAPMVHAADSYRWLTVTIETPWFIFLFLLPLVLIPLILMAILYWRFAARSAGDLDDEGNRRGPPREERPVTDGQR